MARAPKHQIETRTCQQDTKIQLRTHPHSLQNECFPTWRSQWRWGWIEVVVRRICTHELTVCTLSQSSFVGCELLSMQSSVGPILLCPGRESTVEGESWKEAPWGQDSSVGICAIMILCAIEMVVRYQMFFCFAVLLLSNVIVNCCSLLNLRLSNLTKL